MIRASPQVADWLKILDKQSKIILLAIIEALESRKGKKTVIPRYVLPYFKEKLETLGINFAELVIEHKVIDSLLTLEHVGLITPVSKREYRYKLTVDPQDLYTVLMEDPDVGHLVYKKV